ncbi:MAG: cytochrome c-type biogenesis protein CcmH [Burkholderiaceae bacterium]|nr:cytochrome c-type biogenesis protein CcmH [Burkholderiaceae bacterium]
MSDANPSTSQVELDAAGKARFERLASELRCLVCQNQTLADSNADLAGDLRREVQGLIAKGRSDDEIKAFLVTRYGDFVLYRPPLKDTTWPLWIGPFALLAAGAAGWWLVQRRQRRGIDRAESATGVESETGPAPAEDARARARRMLD